MIPILTTTRPEHASNLLAERFRTVLVQAHYDNYTRIRFRADLVRDPRVFFGKVRSQIVKWHEQGGVLISWRRCDEREGEHDAILFAECPKSLDMLYRSCANTRSVAVVYTPPTWRPHEETIALRHAEKPEKALRQLKRVRMLRDVLADKPTLSRARLSRLLPALPGTTQSSSSPGSPAGAGRSPDRAD